MVLPSPFAPLPLLVVPHSRLPSPRRSPLILPYPLVWRNSAFTPVLPERWDLRQFCQLKQCSYPASQHLFIYSLWYRRPFSFVTSSLGRSPSLVLSRQLRRPTSTTNRLRRARWSGDLSDARASLLSNTSISSSPTLGPEPFGSDLPCFFILGRRLSWVHAPCWLPIVLRAMLLGLCDRG